MTAWPVIARELRVEARRPFNYWLRLGAAAGAIALVSFMSLTLRATGGGPEEGLNLFVGLNCTVMAAIWLFVPAMTADCLARERREGTLGLLFLTRLNALGIVASKCLVQSVRGAGLLLAMCPVFVLPVLMGGVGWKHLCLGLIPVAISLILALAAGVMASAIASRMERALGLAYLFAVALLVWFGWNLPSLIFWFFRFSNSPMSAYLVGPDFEPRIFVGTGGIWTIVIAYAAMFQGWFITLWIMLALAIVFLIVVASLAALRIQPRRETRTPGVREQELSKVMLQPRFFGDLFRQLRGRQLDRNPIRWLQRRTWSARLLTWVGLLTVICLSTVLVYRFESHYHSLEEVFTVGTSIIVAVVLIGAASSFRSERETGFLELILTTPLRESALVWGRLQGLWLQHSAAAVAWLIAIFYIRNSGLVEIDFNDLLLFFGAAYVLVPVIGLYCSVSQPTYIRSLFATGATAFVAPLILTGLVQIGLHAVVLLFGSVTISTSATSGVSLRWWAGQNWLTIFLLFQAVLAAIAWQLLKHNFKMRAFSLDR